MTMESDLKSTRLAATGDIFAGPARIKGIHYVAGVAAGTIVIREGGAGGTVLATIDSPADVTFACYLEMPSAGILCRSNAHATITSTAFVTFFWA